MSLLKAVVGRAGLEVRVAPNKPNLPAQFRPNSYSLFLDKKNTSPRAGVFHCKLVY